MLSSEVMVKVGVGVRVGLELDDDEGGGFANVGLVTLNGLRQGLRG